jgi:ABC-type polysaccharide/polyol phosphate export permease
MSEAKTTVNTNSIGFFGLLTLIFITLKLTGYIDWSWWLVLLPLFIPVIIIFAILAIMFSLGARVRNTRKSK